MTFAQEIADWCDSDGFAEVEVDGAEFSISMCFSAAVSKNNRWGQKEIDVCTTVRVHILEICHSIATEYNEDGDDSKVFTFEEDGSKLQVWHDGTHKVLQ